MAALVRLANARYFSLAVCNAGRLGNQCIAGSGSLISGSPANCPLQIPSGSPDPAANARKTLLAVSEPCTAACAEGMEAFLYSSGCCAATAAEAQAEWLAAVRGNPWLGQHFKAQWPDGRVEEFIMPSQCGSGGETSAECGAVSCGLLWPLPCCDTMNCSNGGQKEYPSACYCSCPAGWIEANCTGHAAHVLAAFAISGLTREAFETRFRDQLFASIAAATAPQGISASGLRVELDSVSEVPAPSRRQYNSDVAIELHLTLRIILVAWTGDGRQDVLRAVLQLEQSVDSGLLGTKIQFSTAELSNSIRMLQTPEAFDAAGNRVCDSVLLPCAFSVSTSLNSTSDGSTYGTFGSSAGVGSGGSFEMVIAAVAGTVAFISVAIALECKRQRRLCFAVKYDKDDDDALPYGRRSLKKRQKGKQRRRSDKARKPAIITGQLVFADWSTDCHDSSDGEDPAKAQTILMTGQPISMAKRFVSAAWTPLSLPADAWDESLLKPPLLAPPIQNALQHHCPEFSREEIELHYIEAAAALSRCTACKTNCQLVHENPQTLASVQIEEHMQQSEIERRGLPLSPKLTQSKKFNLLPTMNLESLRPGGEPHELPVVTPPLRPPSPRTCFSTMPPNPVFKSSPRISLLALQAELGEHCYGQTVGAALKQASQPPTRQAAFKSVVSEINQGWH